MKTRPTGLMLTCYTLLCTIMVVLYNVTWHHHLNKLQLHIPKDHACAISQNSVDQFWRIRFSKVYITIAMFKLALAINLLLM